MPSIKLHVALLAAGLLGAAVAAPAWSAIPKDGQTVIATPSAHAIVIARHGADDPPGDNRGNDGPGHG